MKVFGHGRSRLHWEPYGKRIGTRWPRSGCAGQFSTGHRWAVQWGELVEGDVGDAALVDRTLRCYGIDAVMHFAASSYVGESIGEPHLLFCAELTGNY